jgi:hypothetical protein
MVLPFDSLSAGFLFAATLVSWRMMRHGRPGACAFLRFASMLVAALAVSLLVPVPGLGLAVALLVSSLTSALYLLAVCFPQRAPDWLSALLLLLAAVMGLSAILVPAPVVAAAGQAAAAVVILAVAFSHFAEDPRAALLAGAGAVAMFAGAMTLMNGTPRELVLFFAATLLLFARGLQQTVADWPAHWHLAIGGEQI